MSDYPSSHYLQHWPDETDIITERLILRVPELEFAEKVCNSIQESAPELEVYMEWARVPSTIQTATDWVTKSRNEFDARLNSSLMILDHDLEHVGSCGLQIRRQDELEIGYWLKTSRTGCGYAAEVAKALYDFATNTLHSPSVLIRTAPDNFKSAAVAIRAGFEEVEMVEGDRCFRRSPKL